MIETERKYLKASRPFLRRALASLGARSHGCHFESNTIFDMPGNPLLEAGKLLRLRLQEWPDMVRGILTFKQPVCNLAPDKKVKAREELETEFANPRQMAEILKGCGFRQVARYEKLREEWDFGADSSWASLKVDLDIMPFGFVAEIEGIPERMDSLEQALSLDKSQISLKTYHELNRDWRNTQGLPPSADLLFTPARRLRFRKLLRLD